MAAPDSTAVPRAGAGESTRPWPRISSYLLVSTGALLAAYFFVRVIRSGDLPWHPARNSELQATYDAFVSTGVALVKKAGSGSTYTQLAGQTGWVPAAWDDDPGVYLLAGYLGRLRGDLSPLPAVTLLQAVLVAAPMIWLPTVVARVFGRARAGLALLLLPILLALTMSTAGFLGTEYNLPGNWSGQPVYGLYGIAASAIFLSLSLLMWAATHRLSTRGLVALSLVFGVVAGLCDLARAASGVTVVGALVVLWWWFNRGARNLWKPVAAGVLALLLALATQSFVMGQVNASRAALVGTDVAALPQAHGTWHPLYLGLAYSGFDQNNPSPFGVEWSDQFAWNKARAIEPQVVIASVSYDQIIKGLYLDEIRAHPIWALRLYVLKLLDVARQMAPVLIFILLALLGVAGRGAALRHRLAGAILLLLPTLLYGLVPPVLVYPMRYYFGELSAGLGLLFALAVGGMAMISTTRRPYTSPAPPRHDFRQRTHGLDVRLSAVVPTRNGAQVLGNTLQTLASALTNDDEIIVVENGSSDSTVEILREIRASWPYGGPELVLSQSAPGLGHALRTGVLESRGKRCLLTADDLPFGLGDLDEFCALSDDVVVAIGSKGHPGSVVVRSNERTRLSLGFRILREVLLGSRVSDSQGTFWVRGDWARNFAAASAESGLLWTTELVLAAESQDLDVVEVPVTLTENHNDGLSRFSRADALSTVVEMIKLSGSKDFYAAQAWGAPTGPEGVAA